jgi:L-alanine-DL-glutamate epimerase-like enolase superfamily enzyme
MELRLGLSETTLQSHVRASGEIHSNRSHLYLSLEENGIRGFAEISPQSISINGDPSLEEVVQELKDISLPQFEEARAREGSIPSWTRIARFAGSRPSSSFAIALIETAVLDFELRSEKKHISDVWQVQFETPTQSTVSILDETIWVIDPTASRVRVKTSPGVISGENIERLRSIMKPVILDFNCSAKNDDDVLSQVAALHQDIDLVAVEQPFEPGNVVDHSRLKEQLSVTLSLDEGVRSIRDIEQIARYSAATLICIKPARVGGLANARAMVAKAHSLGIDAYIGGFFESSYGRTVLKHLANSSTDQPSDLNIVQFSTGTDESNYVSDAFSFGIHPTESFLQNMNTI